MGCYIWYIEEETRRGRSPPRPIIAVPNVTARPSTASVPITVLLYGPLLCRFTVPIKGLTDQVVPWIDTGSSDGWLIVYDGMQIRLRCRRYLGTSTADRSTLETFWVWRVRLSVEIHQQPSPGSKVTIASVYIDYNLCSFSQYSTVANKKLSRRRETARCFVSLNISLSHSGSLKVIENTPLNRRYMTYYQNDIVTMALSCISEIKWDIRRNRDFFHTPCIRRAN